MFDRKRPADGTSPGRNAGELPPSSAILLCGEIVSTSERNLTRLLDFFGIPWKTSLLGELAVDAAKIKDTASSYCVLSAASTLALALKGVTTQDSILPRWLQNAASVYIFDFQGTPLCLELLRYLTSAEDASIRESGVAEASVSVTNDFRDLCGPMAGLQMPVKFAKMDSCFGFSGKKAGWRSIISTNFGEIFVSATRNGVPFFLNAGSEIIDINAPTKKFFDVKDNFSSAVPVVMYLKWAFTHLYGNTAEIRACLIVDDPPLKPRYGFLRFHKVLELMDAHDFTMSIAFIPWNWRRTDPKTVRMFQQRADRLSLCVHGCDHTAGEFAARSTALLNGKTKIAIQRMQELSRATSLQHDQIMVFPQGAFSPEAARALKLNGFVAAVNTEVAPSGEARNDTLVSDLWSIANREYGSFPIFTRRYLTHGIENFAFDGLLGKPCLIVAHHEVFKKGASELTEFIGRLNSLNWNLKWCSLGNVISHSSKFYKAGAGVQTVQMAAEHAILDNQSSELREFVVAKPEKDPDSVKAVLINGKRVDNCFQENQLQFKLTIPAGGRAEVRIAYLDNLDIEPVNYGLSCRLKIRARRLLSELRDNYLSHNNFLFAAAARVKQFLS